MRSHSIASRPPRFRRVVVTCALVSFAAPALAQQPPAPAATDPLTQGRQEFDIAEKELNLGHYEKALQHFEAAYRLTNKPALLFNLGFVNRKMYERSRNIAYLEEAVERLKAFMEITANQTEPKVLAQRERAGAELKAAEDDLGREKAQRAKGEEALTVGEEFLAKGRLDEAKSQLESYEHTPGNERAGIVRALVLRGGLLAAQGKTFEASDTYQAALELDRSLEDKSLIAPTAARAAAVKAFASAQGKIAGTPVLALSHVAPGSIKPGAPLSLSFTSSVDTMALVRGVRLYYRAGSGAFSSLPEPQPVGAVALPKVFLATLLPGARIEYYANIVDKNDGILQHFGTELLPFAVDVEKPTQNLAKKWWLWTAVGGALVVAGGAAYLTYAYLNPPPQDIPIITSALSGW